MKNYWRQLDAYELLNEDGISSRRQDKPVKHPVIIIASTYHWHWEYPNKNFQTQRNELQYLLH